jgi:hypothetical protein
LRKSRPIRTQVWRKVCPSPEGKLALRFNRRRLLVDSEKSAIPFLSARIPSRQMPLGILVCALWQR